MPKFGLDNADAFNFDVYVDGVRQWPVMFADTDDGFAVVYLTEPADISMSKSSNAFSRKLKLDDKGNYITETVWGKVEVRNKDTGEVHK